MTDTSTPQSRKRPFIAFATDHHGVASQTTPTWPALGQMPQDLEVHIAQIGADARKLLRHQNHGAVPFAVLSPLLLSCIDVAKKYSQEVAKGVDVPGQPTAGTPAVQLFRTSQAPANILDEESDQENQPSQLTPSHHMTIPSTFQQFAEEAAAFADLSPALLQPTGTTSAILQQANLHIDPNWQEIIVKPQWTNDISGGVNGVVKPRVISIDKLRKIETSLTNLLITAKPAKGIPSDARLVRCRQLKSGTFSLRTASTQGIDQLVDNIKKWTELFGPSAQIYIPSYSIKIYSIKRSSFSDANGQLMDEPSVLNALINNGGPTTSYLLPGSVAAVRWNDLTPASTQHSCIIIDFRHPESANAAVRLGLSWSGSLHKPNFLHPEMDFIQCDRCLQYTHKDYQCDNEIVCELCAGPHSKIDCPSTGVFKPHAQRFRNKQCASCGEGHSARFEKCKIRLAEHERARVCRKDLKSTPYRTHPVREKPKFLTVASSALYTAC